MTLLWFLIIIGGAIAVTILGPITVTGYGDFDSILSSALKAGVSIILVILWVLVLSKIKNFIFNRLFQE